MLWDQEVGQMHSVFFFFSDGTDGCMDVKVYWHERRGRNCWPHPKRDYCLEKERERNTKRVRRRCKGEYGLTMNSQNGCPPLMLTSQRDSVDLAVGQGERREILSGTFLTDSRRSPIHPATHMLTITYTHTHPHAQTHCLTSQCELFGF